MRFDTLDLAGVDAFETYQSRGWPGFAGAYDISGDIDRFFYRSTIIPAKQMSLYSFEVSGLSYKRTAANRRDGRDHVLIQVSKAGGVIQGEMGGTPFPKASVGVADFTLDLEQTSADTRADCVLLDRDLFRPGEVEALRGFRWRSGGAALMADYVSGLATAAQLGATPDAQRLMVVLRACKGGDADAMHEAAPELKGVAAERAIRFMRSKLRETDVTPASIAAAAGVSRATLYRVFSPLGGVVAVMQAERLSIAAAQLSEPGDRRSITDIAHASGFVDAAHFSRAFRSRYGLRPTDIRSAKGTMFKPQVSQP